MADSQSKIDAEAEKAFAAAAEKKAAGSISAQKVEKAVAAEPAAPVETAAIAKAVKRKPAKTKPAAGKARKKPAAKRAVAKKAALASKPVPAKKAKPATKKPAAKPATKTPPISQLKETIMATAETATIDYTTKAKEMAADMQTRAKAAYDKGTEMTKEAVEFQKGNLEALVESGKILVSGMQDLGRTYADEAKSAAETVQGDVKKVAEIKSPTELFQLQGDIARRNFDAMVSATSKNTEAMLKLVNDAFAPVSNRMSLAAEKVGKAA